jgi:hypothetical protein
MDSDYDIYEKLPDGKVVWRFSVAGATMRLQNSNKFWRLVLTKSL